MLEKIIGKDNAYTNRADVLRYTYQRIIFIRGAVIDFPLFIAVCYFVPWDYFYQFDMVLEFIGVMEKISNNIAQNRQHSSFPEYALPYLSFIHALGLLALVLPFVFSARSERFTKVLKNVGKMKSIKYFLSGIFSVVFFVYLQLYLDVITYFGCYECSYNNKLSLIAGGVVPWVCANYVLNGTILIYRSVCFLAKNNLWEE